jgi:hypothetical protein
MKDGNGRQVFFVDNVIDLVKRSTAMGLVELKEVKN